MERLARVRLPGNFETDQTKSVKIWVTSHRMASMTYIQSPQAIHEAGHAVMLRHFGVPLCDVRIYPAKGCVLNEGKTMANKAAISALCSDSHAATILAGFVADCHHAGCSVEWNYFRDEIRYASDRARLTSVLQNCQPADAVDDDDDDEIFDRPVNIGCI